MLTYLSALVVPRRKREGFRADGTPAGEDLAMLWLWLLLLLLILVIALALAAQCGGGYQYLAAILDPMTYVIIRIAIPC